MLSSGEILQLLQSLIWLLAGVGVFIVGMNFMGDALEKSAGSGMKKLLEKISNNRFSGVGIGAEMAGKNIKFSDTAKNDLKKMHEKIIQMFTVSADVFDNLHTEGLAQLSQLENEVDGMKKA